MADDFWSLLPWMVRNGTQKINFVNYCSNVLEFGIKPNAIESIRIFMLSNVMKFRFLVTFTINSRKCYAEQRVA